MNSELVNTLVNKFEESTHSIDRIYRSFNGLITMLEKLEQVASQVKGPHLEEITKIAHTVGDLQSGCKQTMDNLAGKSKEFDAYVSNLDQYASTHEKELKKSVKLLLIWLRRLKNSTKT